LLQHQFPAVRAAGVDTLGEWLAGDHPGQVLAARAELRRIADDDLPRVGDKARALLGEPTREQLRAAAEAQSASLVEAARTAADEITAAAKQAAAKLLKDATNRLAAAKKEADALVAEAKRQAQVAEPVPPPPRLLDGVAVLWVGDPPLGYDPGFDSWAQQGALVHTAANLTAALRDVEHYPINAVVWSVGWAAPRWSRLNDLRRSGYKGRIIVFTQSVSADLFGQAKQAGVDGIAGSAEDLRQWLSSIAAELLPS
jgi:hypothetical protein